MYLDGTQTPADEGIQLPDAALAAVQTAVNAVLGLDPEGAARLAAIQGRVLRLELAGFGTRVCVVPGKATLMLYGNYQAEPDCTVRGSAAALLGMALAEHREDSVFSGDVEISGDNALAQTLGEILQGLDIDWQELLSKAVGDVVAEGIARQARDADRWARRSADTLTRNLGEWLQEEARMLPARDELQGFLDAVDTLRDDTERLAARVDRLAARRR
ncbi:sterol-binding protein [Thiohalocapsa marina]|uniref:Ubiquinone biosynthesis accessory factor UbiJ n=1 Tax=Thiohalocapsa marina TaxID=424902 RepID=A0A5M8FUE7_9GAMM|nr:SCP2 sterol-binding domain-containing protein [Thiohalocapsa marina]KAA6187427.1 sterol-binding protein [Thiohalocapsa marina]